MSFVIAPCFEVLLRRRRHSPPPFHSKLALLSGITNYEEYSLIQEVAEEKKEDGVGTLRKDRTLQLRDERKMEKLKAKLHTDDDCE